MDRQLLEALKTFYMCPVGFSTDEVYEEYCGACKKDKVKPRQKSIVIREVCKACGLRIEPDIKHYFRTY